MTIPNQRAQSLGQSPTDMVGQDQRQVGIVDRGALRHQTRHISRQTTRQHLVDQGLIESEIRGGRHIRILPTFPP
ncbi:MAG: hypothetical protein RLZZ127_3289 [Planctomycetota bacterium]